MQLGDVLDLLRRLIEAAQHPDVAEVRVYSGGPEPARNGIAVKDRRGGHMYLAGAAWKGETPVDVPEILPPPKVGAQRIAILTVQLLNAARPSELQDWRLVALTDLGPTEARSVTPSGVSLIAADGTRFLLRALHGGSQTGDPADEPEASQDWRVPESLAI